MTGSPEADAGPRLPAGTEPEGIQQAPDGVGPLVHRIYRTRVVGTDVGPEELMSRIAADLDVVAPSEFATFQKLDGDGPATVGDEYVVRMPGPWDGPVRVVAARPDTLRLATLSGHLEAGQIEFRVRRAHRGLEFTIESWARSGDRLSDLLYTHLRLAKEIQVHMWTSVLERVVKLARGRMEGGIVMVTRRVDPGRLRGEDTDGAGRRSRRRLAGLSRRAVNFDATRIAQYTRATGWHVDDMVEPLPHEAPGPPQPNGVWEVARELLVGYQLADPGIVRAVYRHDAPLEGRDMLLRIRFLGVPFSVGVRVGEVYEEDRELDGRSAHVFGWSYRTLDGHFEQGEMHYQVWKWLDTGDVEFRLYAVSRARRAGPVGAADGLPARRAPEPAALLPPDLPPGPAPDRDRAGDPPERAHPLTALSAAARRAPTGRASTRARAAWRPRAARRPSARPAPCGGCSAGSSGTARRPRRGPRAARRATRPAAGRRRRCSRGR